MSAEVLDANLFGRRPYRLIIQPRPDQPMTKREWSGASLQERSLLHCQQFATGVYRTELASRLQEFGYGIARGKPRQARDHGAIRGSTLRHRARREQTSLTYKRSAVQDERAIL